MNRGMRIKSRLFVLVTSADAVAERIGLADALGVPITCLSTAGEGGPWGMALLAAYRALREKGEALEDFLKARVFASAKGSTLAPTASGKTGFDAWLARYRGLLEAEKAAVASL